MKPLTKTSVTPELLDTWAMLDQIEPSVGAGACCLTHQVKAMQPKPSVAVPTVKKLPLHQVKAMQIKPRSHIRSRKPLKGRFPAETYSTSDALPILVDA